MESGVLCDFRKIMLAIRMIHVIRTDDMRQGKNQGERAKPTAEKRRQMLLERYDRILQKQSKNAAER